MKFNIKEVNNLIHERRSVYPKDYTGEPVDDSVIDMMLENAIRAPSHKLTEPWRFVVFTDQGLHKLAEFQASCYRQVTERDGTFREDRYRALLTKPLESSHIIAIAMKRDPKKSLPEIEEAGAVFCAVQNMYLTATACGIGCYFSTGGITYFEEAKEFFGLESEDRLLGFMQVGIPKNPGSPTRRTPVTEKSRWVR